MHRELEALLTTYLKETAEETRLIAGILTALASGAAARQQMTAALAAAVARPIGDQRSEQDKTEARLVAPAPIDMAEAIAQLRAARIHGVTH